MLTAQERRRPATYSAAHQRVRRVSGPASERACVVCDGAGLHWAYIHGSTQEQADGRGPWSPDPADYLPMCARCHRLYDTLAYRRRRPTRRDARGRLERELKSLRGRVTLGESWAGRMLPVLLGEIEHEKHPVT